MKKLISLVLALTMLSAVPASAVQCGQTVRSCSRVSPTCTLSVMLSKGCPNLETILSAACGSGNFQSLLESLLQQKPAVPSTPAVKPSQPVTPPATDTPAQPEVPETPPAEEPEQPQLPVQPEVPEEPETPAQPETPSVSGPTLANGSAVTTENIQAILYGLKAQYPEGRSWTNANSYYCRALNTMGYGCAAYAFICSDAVFGSLPVTARHSDFSRVRVGDILRVNNDSHSVVVLEVRPDSVVVTEGNYNSSIHWGRVLTRQNLLSGNFVAVSRYPA